MKNGEREINLSWMSEREHASTYFLLVMKHFSSVSSDIHEMTAMQRQVTTELIVTITTYCAYDKHSNLGGILLFEQSRAGIRRKTNTS